jgi:predicted nucleic acid-binding protein
MNEPDPSRVVADADVLVADLLGDEAAREALDVVRSHSWLTLVVTERLLDDAEAIIADLRGEDLALAWRVSVEGLARIVEQSPGDHPALAAAYHGDAAQILSFDEDLQSAHTGATLKPRLSTSIRSPDAFLTVFDPERLYTVVVGGEYPGPDRDPSG